MSIFDTFKTYSLDIKPTNRPPRCCNPTSDNCSPLRSSY